MINRLVKLDRQDEIATITLNRPDRHNALVPELLSELLEAFEFASSWQESVIVLQAEGSSFSTGGDVLGFYTYRHQIADYAFKLIELLNKTILAMYHHPAVVVCSVQGQVTGGSLGLLLASDWVVMRRDTTITPWYNRMGFSPDGGWIALLSEIIGREQAVQWLTDDTSHTAEFCRGVGLVHQLADETCNATALTRAMEVSAKKPPEIYKKSQLLKLDGEDLRNRLDAERDAFVQQIQSQTALDGIDQYLRRQ